MEVGSNKEATAAEEGLADNEIGKVDLSTLPRGKPAY
jgi:hypothetical protein